MRWSVAAVVAAMVLLHQDFWLWNDATLVFGVLPAGLAYHVGYSITASAVLALIVRHAWPRDLEAEEPAPRPAAPDAGEAAPEVVP